jgi:integrase
LALQEKKLAPATFAKAVWALETFVYPYIGSRPIAKLNAADVLKVLKRIEGRGIHETAHRTRQRCSQVFRYAVQTERAAHDVTADLRGALAPVVSEHHAAITDPVRIGELPRAIDGYTGHGFRSLASTCLNEQGYHPDLIELQLAHAERTKYVPRTTRPNDCRSVAR